MDAILTIPFNGKVSGGAGIEFKRAEVPQIEDPVFALIRYARNGNEPEIGLRLDLDKQVFLDHFEEGSPQERVLLDAAPRILQLVYAKLDGEEPPEDTAGIRVGGPRFEFEDDSPLVELPHG
jgi:hypothetical protein